MYEVKLKPSRIEAMHFLAQKIESIIEEFLKKIDDNWQPADFLPDSSSENFIKEIKELRAECKELPYDYMAVLVGDTITEEALPTYESWLLDVDGITKEEPQGWSKWIRMWTAEENRHGDLLNKFLYLSGRVNMKQMEISTQYLIADGMDNGAARDPYKNFVYTSFQELATNISHRRTATLAKKHGSNQLSQICGVIAADEARHAKAYKSFVAKIFEIDASEMMLAFEDMMRKRIAMPAHFMRQAGESIGKTFAHFSDAAQRLGVYTSLDYTHILESLIQEWDIANIGSLTGAANKARDYLMTLPDRFKKISERGLKAPVEYQFSWIRY
ncbi:MAG TPA: acyl-ACP desaturase [Chitinophagaceae bacterium]|nr:acyl-ACP desaturase [Chitinophagaceae bacterium]